MPLIHVDDPRDPRIALYGGVSDPELLRTHGAFVAEGRLVVRRLLTASRMRARSVLVTAAGLDAVADVLEAAPDLPVYVAPQIVMNGVAGVDIHRGCLALGVRPPPLSVADLLRVAAPPASARRCARCVVLEGVGNADNVGGIFRSVAALGGHAVVLGPHCCDPFYRKAIRTSIGATLQVPFASAVAWPDALDELRASGFTILALTPAEGASELEQVALHVQQAPRLAIVLGAEGPGMTAAALARSDVRVRIPLTADMDSLNVTVAASIALYRLRW